MKKIHRKNRLYR